MAKDPAMLWYWSDWNSGTSLMSRFLKGCYIDLLHAQFNNGPLSLEEIKICLGADFANAWLTLQKKFKQTKEGLFFNERLEREKQKRKDFSESRRNNVKKRYIDSTYVYTSVEHMNLHMENTNENRNENFKEEEKGVGKGEGFFVNEISIDLELTNVEVNVVKSYIEAVLQKKINDREVKNYWKAFKIDNFSKHEWYHSHEDLISHFRRSLENKLNNKKHGTTKSTYGTGTKVSSGIVIRSDKTFDGTL